MRNGDKLLFIGPATVIGTILTAHLCARALAEWPSSSLVWYLNLQVFRPLRYWDILFSIEQMPGGAGLAQTILIAAPLFALLLLGLLLHCRLPLAIAAHLGFLYSALILYCSCVTSAATLPGRIEFGEASNLVVSATFLCSLISAGMSHRMYWREILSERETYDAIIPCNPNRPASARGDI